MAYFPYDFSADIGSQIASDKREIQTLVPALLEPAIQADAGNGQVRVGARQHNGAIYVIAVNTTQTTVQARIAVDGIAGRSVTVFGTGAVVGSDDQGFSDTFGPLAARVYVIPPPGW